MPEKDAQKKPSHFNWTDGLILLGALVILPAAVYQGNWHFLIIGVALIAAVLGRVAFTIWLAKRDK
jgi:hypothetical protein